MLKFFDYRTITYTSLIHLESPPINTVASGLRRTNIAVNLLILLSMLALALPWMVYAQDEEQEQQPPATPATNTQSSPPKPMVAMPKNSESLFNQDAGYFYQADELKQLLAGDSDFYVLFQDDMTGRAKGVVLLIPDWGQHPASNRGLDYLRTQLPDYGWVTLSMTVPPSQEQVYTTQIDPPNNSEKSTTPATPAPVTSTANVKAKPVRLLDEDFFSQYELQLQVRMQAMMAEAQNYQGYFIVVAQGSSAAVLASLYAKEAIEAPEAFIVMSAFVPDHSLSQKMNQDITVSAIPTLDIYQSHDSRWMQQNVALRQKLARKNFKVHYRQKELYGDISYHNQNRRLLKIIYGWLTTLGL